MRLTLDHTTANGKLMLDPTVNSAVTRGIDNPSDAIIPAETSLYRAAHSFLTDPKTGAVTKTRPDQAFLSPWWSTYYDFNQVAWATDAPDLSEAARSAFAIHRGWGGDCALYASITTTTDLSVWYGLGKNVPEKDLGSPQMSIAFASQDILQIYIPGLWVEANMKLWTIQRRVMAFERTLTNGRGFQGNLPAALRPAQVGSTQMTLF